MPTHHPTFPHLIQNDILELRKQHPDWTRLDGSVSGGNRKIYATFKYKDKTWKIHSDTRFDALLTASTLVSASQEPFEIAATQKGNPCLRLPGTPKGAANGLYVYLYESSAIIIR